jgi:hypothetical protein
LPDDGFELMEACGITILRSNREAINTGEGHIWKIINTEATSKIGHL